MESLKPLLSDLEVQTFFRTELNIPTTDYEPVAHGETSQAFFFGTEHGERVLRLNTSNQDSFIKDAYAAELFSKPDLPIPRTTELGQYTSEQGPVFYSVTERACGVVVKDLNLEDQTFILPALIEQFDTLRNTTPAGDRFGWWHPNTGHGIAGSWQDALLETQQAGESPELDTVAFFDRAVREQLKAAIAELLPFCPEERSLVHGDFSAENVIINGGAVTGVIDWYNAMYGDSLYDVAWLDFGSPELGIAAAYRDHHIAAGTPFENYGERVRCYQLLIGMNAMVFFANIGKADKYQEMLERLTNLETY